MYAWDSQVSLRRMDLALFSQLTTLRQSISLTQARLQEILDSPDDVFYQNGLESSL